MQSFLLIQTAFIGDAILATAVLEKLHRFYPQARIDVLVRKGNEGIFGGHPFLNEVLVWDKKRKYADWWRLWRLVRARRYGAVVNLQRFGAMGLLTALSGAGQRIGFDKNPFARFFTRRLPHILNGAGEHSLHEVERNLSLIEHLTDAEFCRPRLYPQSEDYAAAEALSGGSDYVCLAPASVWATKQLPAERWVQFLKALPPSYKPLLLGAASDAELCRHIAERSGRTDALVAAGRLNLLQSAALMQGARMNYCNDSAPLHLASAVNAPVCVVFCSTVPEFGFGPLSDTAHIIQYAAALPCRPCGLHGKRACPQGHFRCADIETERLLEVLV